MALEPLDPEVIMLQPKSASLAVAIATGTLRNRPLAHLLAYAFDKKLFGTFELKDDTGEQVDIVVACGMVARIRTSEPVIYLGYILYENGVIDGRALSRSLSEVAATKALHGEILIASGVVDVAQLSDALRQQRERKLHHAFTLSPRATFAFYADRDLIGDKPNDVEPMDPLASIWRGVRAHPSWEHVRATIATLAGRPLRLTGSVDRLRLEGRELLAAKRLAESAATVSELVVHVGMDRRAADLLAYFLLITKVAQIIEPTSIQAGPAAPPNRPVTDPNVHAAAMQSGEYQRKISFTMRAVHAGSHPLRIPSPMPGSFASPVAAATPRPVTHAEPPAGAGAASVEEADHVLSEAEMHAVLGEREGAVRLVRKALALAPSYPPAMAFLAYLEALGCGAGQESYLRDLLRMVDSALIKDDLCRRGRFYRAEIKKRLRDHEGALRDLRVARERDPDDGDVEKALAAYERRVREGSIILRSLSPFNGTPRPSGLVALLRGRKTPK